MIDKISRVELQAKLGRGEAVTLVEALPESYWRDQHLPGAISLPHDKVDALAAGLLPDKAAEIVVYCSNTACQNSTIAARRLAQLGYTRVHDYVEGKQDWIEAGLPVERVQV
jgi:rhodanese-related sulfurtransferase